MCIFIRKNVSWSNNIKGMSQDFNSSMGIVDFYCHDQDRGTYHQYWTGRGQTDLFWCIVSNLRNAECAIALICNLLLVFYDTTLRFISLQLWHSFPFAGHKFR